MKEHHKPFILRKKQGNHKQKWQDHGHGCDGKSLIIFPVFGGFILAFFFHNIEICQTDQACKTVEQKNGNSVNMIHAKLKSQHNGKDSETDNIRKRIDLDPEALLFLRSVLLGSRNLSVKHITQPGKCQTAHCC